MKYVVIQSGGKQYKVSEGSVIEVEKLDVEEGNELKLDSVLFYAADGAFKVGQPELENFAVIAKVLEQKKGKKLRIAKFKAKARYRRVTGHRQRLTKLEVMSIIEGKAKKEASKKELA
jgi:large subunit ribosomal protein L21